MTSPVHKVILMGAPERCGFAIIQEKVEEFLTRDVVTGVKKCKRPDGSTILGKFEVELASDEDVEELLKKARLPFEMDDEYKMVLVTRCRPIPTVASSPALRQARPVHPDLPKQSSEPALSEIHAFSGKQKRQHHSLPEETSSSDDDVETIPRSRNRKEPEERIYTPMRPVHPTHQLRPKHFVDREVPLSKPRQASDDAYDDRQLPPRPASRNRQRPSDESFEDETPYMSIRPATRTLQQPVPATHDDDDVPRPRTPRQCWPPQPRGYQEEPPVQSPSYAQTMQRSPDVAHKKLPSPKMPAQWPPQDGRVYEEPVWIRQIPTTKTNFYEILRTDPEVFNLYRDNGALVQFEDSNLTVKQVGKFFNEHHNWQPLKTFLLEDGYFLVYKHKRTAEDVVRTCRTINGTEVRVCLKPFPAVYKDRFLIEGDNLPPNGAEYLREILESRITHTTFMIKVFRSSNLYLVIFKKDIDIREVQNELKGLKLGLHEPRILKACRTDCVKIQNLPENAIEASIKVACANKQYCNSEVTKVERSITNRRIALVYYANYQDAESVAQRKEISVSKKKAQVSLYWTAIGESLDLSSSHFDQFHFKIDKVDEDILAFVHKSHQHENDFRNELSHLAKVEVVSDPLSPEWTFKISPTITPEKFRDGDQDEFERHCKQQIRQFFSKFNSKLRKFSQEDKDRVRKSHGWHGPESFVKMDLAKHKGVNVLVRWMPGDKDAIKVTGTSKDVGSFLEWFHEECKHIRAVLNLPRDEYEIFIDCAIFGEITNIFADSVEIKADEKEQEVVVSGSKDNVEAVRKNAKNSLKRVKRQDTSTFLHAVQQEFLVRSLQRLSNSNEKPEIVNFLQENFKSQDIKVHVAYHGKAVELVCAENRQHEMQQAQQEMKDLFKYQSIPVESGFDAIMQESDWMDLRQRVESTGQVCIMSNSQSSNITLVGYQNNFEQEYSHVSNFVTANHVVEHRIDMTYSQTMFFCDHASKIGVDKHIPGSVDWYKEPGGICLKGRHCMVEKAANWVSSIAATFITIQEVMEKPGMREYFQKAGGKQFLDTTSKETCCFIKLGSADTREWIEARKIKKEPPPLQLRHYKPPPASGGAGKIPPPQPLQNQANQPKGIWNKGKAFIGKLLLGGSSLTLQQEQAVQVKVIGGNIVESKREVMINTVGPDFDIRKSKVSQALLAKAGPEAQAMVAECANNPVIKNDYMRITIGRNTGFKYIVHLVTPESPDLISVYLLDALLTLDKTLDCQSVAVPAIGTGQLNMTDEEAAFYIQKAVDDLRRTNPTVLKQVDVVVFQPSMMKAFETALMSSSNVRAAPAPAQPPIVPPKPVRAPPPVFAGAGGVVVNVEQGDILGFNADVLINTTGGNFDLEASQLSKLLIQMGGDSIKDECKSNPVLSTQLYRVTKGGKTQFQNIVHFVTPQLTNIASDLEKVLVMVNEQLKRKSIAIPAIGTGAAGLPPDQVAEAINQAITNFRATSPTNLTQINIVVYVKNMMSTFRNALLSSGPPPPAPKTRNVNAAQNVPLQPAPKARSNVKVNIISGDVLQSKCKVLINTTGGNFDLKASQLSKKLLKLGGNSIEDECKSHPFLQSQEYRVTKGGSTQFNYIVHFVTPNLNDLAERLEVVLVMVNDKIKESSIAIPAIGTGAAGLPVDGVVQAFGQAITKFKALNPTALNQIDVVIYNDQNMVTAFQSAIASGASNLAAVPPQPSPAKLSNVNVNVIGGNVLESDCQVLINTTGSNFDLNASQVSSQLIKMGGKSIIDECNGNPVVKKDDYRVTKGGQTNFHYIVHMVTPKSGNLAKKLEEVLKMVNDQLKAKSIAMPAIGTGAANMKQDQVALDINRGISNFMASSPAHLKRIDVVIFVAKMLNTFKSNIHPGLPLSPPVQSSPAASPQGRNYRPSPGKTPSGKAKITFGIRSDSKHRLELFITTHSRDNFNKALAEINAKADTKCVKKVLEDRENVLKYFEEKDLWELRDIDREFDVYLQMVDDKSFEISGASKNVNEAFMYGLKLFQKYSKAVMCSDSITWRYEDPDTQSWHKFSLIENFEIETLSKDKNPVSNDLKILMNGKQHVKMYFDCQQKTMTPDGSKYYRIEQVNASKAAKYPSFWNGSKSQQVVTIQSNTTEYKTVVKKYVDGGLCIAKVIELQRVENQALYTQFQAHKQDVIERMNGRNVTRELFHGTAKETCELIYKTGFDRGYSGDRVGAKFGFGVYFAKSASYSFDYATEDAKGHRRMILAEVITGKYAQGVKGMKTAPPIQGTHFCHDSVVDDISAPSMFVVFKDASVYPLYILTFT